MVRFHHLSLTRLYRYISYLIYLSIFFILCVKLGYRSTENEIRDLSEIELEEHNGLVLPIKTQNVSLTINLSKQNCPNNRISNPSLDDVRSIFYNLNTAKCVRNANGLKFRINFVVLVMVHNRAEYLQFLIESITNQRSRQHLNETLVVFSHDVYDEEVFNKIEEITTFKVLQIGFPFSQQIFPNSFPGSSDNDCPRDITKDQALQEGCLNADHPDSYGHYREAKYAAIKHHWWWKLNYVMNYVMSLHEKTEGVDVPVLLIEEDHYLTPDAIQFLDEITSLKKSLCPKCLFTQLGDYSKLKGNSMMNSIQKLRIDQYLSNRNNMGIIIDKAAFEKLTSKECAEVFCKYDDYNWDWSINAQSRQCSSAGEGGMASSFLTLVPHIPRIFHTGICGVHKNINRQQMKSAQCSPRAAIRDFLNKYSLALKDDSSQRDYSLSNNVQTAHRTQKKFKPNGGWGDPRDHKFCLEMVAKNRM
ncbi:alpha-1,6-mannosyl-glycoprotein 2-beta-N-acetylglucosaminyltransferase-like isoform X2 [Symsagittifera roscoffensis]|uniref:alpha-1,6-mannosyl-glycoprotein 2-beta-N-acetylglucosaminyltransferase-like isoform X2 n=1 Tax=Symsagittifera roscoffensis TaxID=84072 RepID=UPI00307C36DB